MTEYLPLGTVCTLKGASKRLMITGRLQQIKSDGQIYDYCACLWPEGSLDANHYYLFNHDQVDKLFHIGLQDIEEFQFRHVLEEMEQQLQTGEMQ